MKRATGHVEKGREPPESPVPLERPHIDEKPRGDAKGDHIRQGIVLHAEPAGGVGHTGNPAVKRVEDARDEYGYARLGKPLIEGGHHCVEPPEEAHRREQVWKEIDAPALSFSHDLSSLFASIVSPLFTF